MGLIAIGDIHGCAASLDALLDRLGPTSDDHLVFIGDYIDRGPDSRGVIERLLKLRDEVQCTFLRGNHEALMLGYFNEGAFNLWRINGGLSTMHSYVDGSSEIEFPDAHIEFVRETKMHYETDDFFFVHAGLQPNLTIAENLEESNEKVFLWERAHLEAPEYAWEKTVVCGHTPRPKPINKEKLLMIDTGCVYHMQPEMGTLTAVHLPEREFVSVDYTG
ncbi:metallophosphoesterase family protein [Salisaeta longa]|uniref:metallophosphoesterase family protein n=1 Tax=Salisaeta longa TaxID=503170 RepID=UPI0003B6BD3A|nr:metallophosphoesterase family protein [Salisaeta longa]